MSLLASAFLQLALGGPVEAPSATWSVPDSAWAPRVVGPRFDAGSKASVSSPRLDLRCHSSGCEWSFHVMIEGRGTASFTATDKVSMEIDGVARGGLRFTLPDDGSSHKVVLSGFTRARTLRHLSKSDFLELSALESRHLALGEGESVDAVFVRVDIPHAKSGGVVRARVHSGWFVTPSQSSECVQTGYTESTSRCEPVVVRHVDAEGEWVSASARFTEETLSLSAQVSSPLRTHGLVLNGGGLVGIGATLGQGFAVRGGYEVGLGSRSLLGSVSVDSDLDRHAVAAITVKGATPLIAFIPSASLGLGIPLRLAPSRERETGLRVEADVNWGPFGFVTSADIWLVSPDRRVTWTLMGTIGF